MKVGTYFFSIILTTLILINSLRVSITYSYYKLDPIGFIEKLCENKDRPKLQCNGKCHLKKISESQNNEQRTPESIIGFKEILFFTDAIEECNILNFADTKKPLFIYINFYKHLEISPLDPPPQV